MEGRRAVFLDRDGVLNRDSPHFIKTPDELHLLPGVPEAVARLNAAGFAVIVITNQSGISRGLLTEATLEAIHARLRAEIEAASARLDAIYHCPHLPGEGCNCRKPAPGMVLRAAREHAIDLQHSFLVGDKPDDIACGAAAGCRTILVLSGQSQTCDPVRFPAAPDHVCTDLPAAVEWIMQCESE